MKGYFNIFCVFFLEIVLYFTCSKILSDIYYETEGVYVQKP